MSINSLTNAAAARRPDFAPLSKVPNGLGEIAMAATIAPAADADGAKPAEKITAANGVNTAMNVLFGYIPAEVLTLYVAVVAAIHPSVSGGAGTEGTTSTVVDSATKVTMADWVTFGIFLVATPIIFWVVYAVKLKSAQKPLPLPFSTWPLWEMFAATIAYCAWAFALPATPFHQFDGLWYSTGLAGVAVLVTSTVLALLAPLFQRPLGTGDPAETAPGVLTKAATA